MNLCPIDINGTVLPPRRWGSSGFVYNDDVYIFGGIVTNGLFNDLWRLQTFTWMWQELHLENSPDSRWGHTFGRIDEKAVVFGGRCGSKPQDMGHLYWFSLTQDNSRWNLQKITSDNRPKKRCGHTSIQVANRIIIFGGHGGRARFYNDTWELTRTAENIFEWNEVKTSGTLPERRFANDGTFINNKLYIVGGTDNKKVFSDLCVLDWQTKVWSTLKINVFNLQGHKLIHFENKFVIFGGTRLDKKKGFLVNNDVEFNRQYIGYDVINQQVFDVPSTQALSCCRSAHSMFKIRNQHICIFGETKGLNATNAVVQLSLNDSVVETTLDTAMGEIRQLKQQTEQLKQQMEQLKQQMEQLKQQMEQSKQQMQVT